MFCGCRLSGEQNGDQNVIVNAIIICVYYKQLLFFAGNGVK